MLKLMQLMTYNLFLYLQMYIEALCQFLFVYQQTVSYMTGINNSDGREHIGNLAYTRGFQTSVINIHIPFHS